MSEPFVGQISQFGFNFNPRGWAFCQGQLIPIAQNTALFSLLGTNYGGNGTTNFALPNFQSRAAAGQGSGPGLSNRVIGETFGSSTVTLSSAQIPAHTHALTAFSQSDPTKRTNVPANGVALSSLSISTTKAFVTAAPNTTFAPTMLSASQGGQPHTNEQPYLAVNFCIALQGIFPARN